MFKPKKNRCPNRRKTEDQTEEKPMMELKMQKETDDQTEEKPKLKPKDQPKKN